MESFIDKLRRRATGIIPDDNPMDSDLMPPQVNEQGIVPNPSYERKESPLVNPNVDPFNNFQKKMPGMNAPDAVTNYTQQGQQKFGLGEKQFQNIFGVSYSQAGESWKNKGGFEALMANPAFTLGLGLMKSSATGQPMSQSLFDNAIKAGAISGQYADRIRNRKQEPIEATAGEIENTKQLLKSMKISEPNFFERVFGTIKGENKQAQFEEAAESITIEFEKEMAKQVAAAKREGKSPVFDTAFKKKIIKKLVKEGKIKKKGGIRFVADATLETKPDNTFKAKGGPVAQGKEYIVGEEGPEMFVPQIDGNVIKNDDTKVVNMLLESNPQLKNVSRARAVKILKNRFPDYF
jgi:hypothetical protein